MKEDMDLKELLERPTVSVQQAAKILGIGKSSAYYAAEKGEIPTIRLSGQGKTGNGPMIVPTARLKKMLGTVE